jgi:hypothetical protein
MPRRSTKSREPEDIRQTALRLREADHAWLTAEAKKHATTLNSEIVWRLLNSRERTLGVELSTTIDAAVRRLTPYLVGATERDAYNEVILAARQMADVLAPLLAAGALKGSAAKEAANGINRLNLARYTLESILGENKPLVPGHASWQAMARASTEARFQDPEGKGLDEKEREARDLWLKEGKTLEEAAALAVKEPEIEEHGVPEPKEPSNKGASS